MIRLSTVSTLIALGLGLSQLHCEAPRDPQTVTYAGAYLIFLTEWKREPVSAGTLSFAAPASRTLNYAPSCAGTPGSARDFAVFVKPGDPERVILFFQGGGACWDGKNCTGVNTTTYTQVYDSQDPWVLKYAYGGMMDYQSPANPYKDWTYVLAPYCSADVFWGSVDRTYVDPDDGVNVSLRHRGFDNMLATLAYVRANHSGAKQILVAGESAGGYGAALAFPYVKNSYAAADVTLLVDSAAGVVPNDFRTTSFNQWNLASTLPDWTGVNSAYYQANTFGDVLLTLANYYPGSRFAQFTTAFDSTQRFFFNVQRLLPTQTYQDRPGFWPAASNIEDTVSCNWNTQMRAAATTAAGAGNFRYFISPGTGHTILGRGNFGVVNSNGVALSDWVNGFVSNTATWTNTQCSDCRAPVSAQSAPNSISCP